MGNMLEVPAAVAEAVGLTNWQRVTATVRIGVPYAKTVLVRSARTELTAVGATTYQAVGFAPDGLLG
jgi:hypothetical protein